MQKHTSLLSGTKKADPMCTRFGEQLQHYRQRVASLVPHVEHTSAEYKYHAEQLKMQKEREPLPASIDASRHYTKEGLQELQNQLNKKEWLGTWSQQRIALNTFLDVFALVTTFGCLRPALVFKRVGESFVLQSFHYDLPLSHTMINNLH